MNENNITKEKIDELEINVKVLNIIELFINSSDTDIKLLLSSIHFRSEVKSIAEEISRIRKKEFLICSDRKTSLHIINSKIGQLSQRIKKCNDYNTILYSVNTDFLSLAHYLLNLCSAYSVETV